jgi:hypothetical protein
MATSTIKMRVLRGFYLNRAPQTPGAIVDVPVHLAWGLVTDRKAEYVKEAPAAEIPPPAREETKSRKEETKNGKEGRVPIGGLK